MNTIKSQNRGKITLFSSRAQASLQSCNRVRPSSLPKGEKTALIHSRAPGIIRKTWISCLCRAHCKNLKWACHFETDFPLSIMQYETQFLICLKAFHANRKQSEPVLKSTKNPHQGRPMWCIPQAHTSSSTLFLTFCQDMFFFHFPLGAGRNAVQPPEISSNHNSTLDAESLVNCFQF